VLVWAGTDGEGGNSSTPDGENGGVDAQQHGDSDEDGDAAIKITFTKIDCVKVQGGGGTRACAVAVTRRCPGSAILTVFTALVFLKQHFYIN
jgi:hypothetical protein